MLCLEWQKKASVAKVNCFMEEDPSRPKSIRWRLECIGKDSYMVRCCFQDPGVQGSRLSGPETNSHLGEVITGPYRWAFLFMSLFSRTMPRHTMEQIGE